MEKEWDTYLTDEDFYVESPTESEWTNTLKPEFSWTELSGAKEYTLVINQYMDDCFIPILKFSGITDTKYSLKSKLEENELYSFNVLAEKDGKTYVAYDDLCGSSFVAKFNPKTHLANVGINYEFKDGITLDVLKNYMARSAACHLLDSYEGNLMNFDENFRMVLYTGAKYLTRAIGDDVYYVTQDNDIFLEMYKEKIDYAHEIDPDLIFEGCVFETCGPETDKYEIPEYVFEAFDLPVEKRNFDSSKMLYDDGTWVNHFGDGISMPDMSKLETQMWWYYRATVLIDHGFEALHLGSTPSISYVDETQGYVAWKRITDLIREYAKNHARRGYVILNGHTKNMKTADDKLVFDFNMWMLCGDIPLFETAGAPTEDNPQELKINGKATEAIYNRTTGGYHPNGEYLDNALYMVELDNYGMDPDANNKPATRGGNGTMPWGIDEIGWFARQPENYRHEWLDYAYFRVQELDKDIGYFNMPLLRRAAHDKGIVYHYRANVPSYGYWIDGKNDEGVIKNVWIKDNKQNK